MREIKFRAWDKIDKRIGRVIEINFNLELIRLAFEKNGVTMACIMRDLNDVELMQYTGVKDRNGNEIYEGDIVELTFQCEYYVDNGHFIKKCIEKKIVEVKFPTWFDSFECDERGRNFMKWIIDIKVIGNKWNNPELLEKGK